MIIILLLRSHRRSLIVRQTLLDQRIYTIQSLFSSLFDYKLKPIILLQLLSNARRVIRCYCLVRKCRVRKQSDSNLANRYWIVTRSLRCVQTLRHGLPKTHNARDTCTHTFILIKKKKVIKTVGTNENVNKSFSIKKNRRTRFNNSDGYMKTVFFFF